MSEETYTVSLPLTLHLCPLCGEQMERGGEVEVWAEEGLRGPTIDAMAEAVQMKMAEALEADIVVHYQRRHRFRYWLWRHTGWKRVLA